MRLIDADQFEVISWRTQGGREYANGFDDGVDYVARKIDDAQTINAIPIEWLGQEIRQEVEYGNTLKAEYIKELIWEWHQEEEE